MANNNTIGGIGAGVVPTTAPKTTPTSLNDATVDPKTAGAAGAAGAGSSSASTTKSGDSSSPAGKLGEQDFLMLLVNQMQNQDPLNPMDPQAFASELAQFSQVEQLLNINKKLDNLGGGPSAVGSLAGFLGTEVVLKGDGADVKGGNGPNVFVDVPQGTQSLRVDLIDPQSGGVVDSKNVDTPEAGKQAIPLTGLTAKDGNYNLRVVSVDSLGRFQELPGKATGTVEGFVVEPEPALLIGGKQVALGDVVEVYKGKA